MLNALTFVLTDQVSGKRLGLAIICPEVRYTSVLAEGSTRFDRRHGPVELWKALDAVAADTLPAAPLERGSPIVELLLGADRPAGVVVQPLAAIPATSQSRPAETLDALLRRHGREADYEAAAGIVNLRSRMFD